MKNIEELHIHHQELTSEILFLKKEIEFLLKILRNCYSTSVNLEKIKLLDAYWKGFELNIDKLDILQSRIKKEEKSMAVLAKEELIDYEKTDFKEDFLLADFKGVQKEVKVMKQSFYEFMHGCNACTLKTS